MVFSPVLVMLARTGHSQETPMNKHLLAVTSFCKYSIKVLYTEGNIHYDYNSVNSFQKAPVDKNPLFLNSKLGIDGGITAHRTVPPQRDTDS